MKNKKKYFMKVAVMAVMAFALKGLDVGSVSNLRDFLTGLAMGGIVVILLELVYSVIADLGRQETS